MSKDQVSRDLAVSFLLQPLKPYFEDVMITEICVNEPQRVFYEKQGHWESAFCEALSYEYLISLGLAIAKFANTDFKETCPILSAELPHGERAQMVMPPACREGRVSLTVRKPSFEVRDLPSYLKSGFFTQLKDLRVQDEGEAELCALQREFLAESNPLRAGELRAEFLKRAVMLGKNLIIAGETGSGKTTFMKTLMQFIPTEERLITIEDVPELMWGLPSHHNVVNLLYPSEGGRDSMMTAASLLRSCLRMKPDRILLAELRGAETYDFLNVCLSGHRGTITSCHAASSQGVFDYLSLKVLQSEEGRALPYGVIQSLLHSVIDVVVCVTNDKAGGRGRHITEIWYQPRSEASPGAQIPAHTGSGNLIPAQPGQQKKPATAAVNEEREVSHAAYA